MVRNCLTGILAISNRGLCYFELVYLSKMHFCVIVSAAPSVLHLHQKLWFSATEAIVTKVCSSLSQFCVSSLLWIHFVSLVSIFSTVDHIQDEHILLLHSWVHTPTAFHCTFKTLPAILIHQGKRRNFRWKFQVQFSLKQEELDWGENMQTSN